MPKGYDFCGYATKNDLLCADGRIIRRNAFKDCDGKTVPLVWQHQHNDPMNILGHALLENREDGVYAYGKFNNTSAGKQAKMLVSHGDINAMSIYANKLQQNSGNVTHGIIREVSLVVAGANPEALIDFPVLSHSGEEVTDEAVIYAGEIFDDYENVIMHSEEEDMEMANINVEEVFETLTDEQKDAVYSLVGSIVSDLTEDDDDDEEYDEYEYDDEDDEEVEHGYYDYDDDDYYYDDFDDEGEDEYMKHNIFDGSDEYLMHDVISDDEMEAIISDGKRFGSLKESALQHGIENIGYMFPDAKTIGDAPSWIRRNADWVESFMNASAHTPFSRVKSIHANITADEARARGYVKGNMKVEEVFSMLKRTTDPCTVYKKQKLDRDDVIDITDFDVVSWMKTEMRWMLDEEIARAALVGDGRASGSDDKISEDRIRPIWKDSSVYTITSVMNVTAASTDADKASMIIDQAVRARKNYKGAGNPTMFTTEDWVTEMLLLKDVNGRRIYKTIDELATAMRVSKIVTVPIMENLTRTVDGETHELAAIIVNPKDYNFGADKGGSVSMFDDFDIDYNAQKYLIETRCSGALVTPYSAIVLEFKQQ